jgi:hypothetical protein
VGTHGRGFWILDDITPLRQLQDSIVKSPAHLFKPQTAVRVRWNTNSDTPLPPDVAAGENPPDGAVIDYYLGSASGPITLEIKDSTGAVVRRYSSDDVAPADEPLLNIPPYWIRPPQRLSGDRGMHRFLWDLHYAPVPGVAPQYPIAAVYRNTAPAPTSPWALPGNYTVVLTVKGKKYEQPLQLTMDPRVKTPTADLAQQFDSSMKMYQVWLALNVISDEARRVRGQITELRPKITDPALKSHLDALGEKILGVAGAAGGGFAGGGGGGAGGGGARTTAASVSGRARTLFGLIEEADVAPTTQIAAALPDVIKDSNTVEQGWQGIKSSDIPALNQELRAAGLPPITVATGR